MTNFEGLTFRVLDVGGQRIERKKWIHCFDEVDLVVFCVSLSDFNLVLREDGSVNRLAESFQLFQTLRQITTLSTSTFVILFTKVDEFAEKLQRFKMEDYFPEYKGSNEFLQVFRWILNQMVPDSSISSFPVCTVDKLNFEFVWRCISKICHSKRLM